MKQEEKNAKSRQLILHAAIQHFSKYPYTESSLNTICSENQISKGLIYHYYKDKDTLYLACVEACFTQMIQHLELPSASFDTEHSLTHYFDARVSFFQTYPSFAALFCEVTMSPPKHLTDEIATIRHGFEQYNIHYFESVLESLPLRKDISRQDALDYFSFIQDSFHSYFHKKINMHHTSKDYLQEHDALLQKTVRLLLYGIAVVPNS